MKNILIVIALLFVFRAEGQVPPLQPANPTAADQITFTVGLDQVGPTLHSVVIEGSQINILVRGQAAITPVGGQVPVTFGPLPAGTYQIVVRVQYTDAVGTIVSDTTRPPFTLVVAPAINPAFVPALDPASLTILAALLGLVGVFVARRSI